MDGQDVQRILSALAKIRETVDDIERRVKRIENTVDDIKSHQRTHS